MGDDLSYAVIAGLSRAEELVRRSRFITTVTRASSAEEAKRFVSVIRDEFPDATHHCWAFQAGPPGDTAAIGMSDDGEPHGTAGKPMLSVLLHSDVGEVAAVCARYYGGVKLGTGGLSRAYSNGVRLALERARTERKVERTRMRLTVDYEFLDPIRRLAVELDVGVLSVEYGARVEFALAVPVQSEGIFVARLGDITKGKSELIRESIL